MNLIKLGIIVNTKGIEGAMAIINTPKGIFLPMGSVVFIGYSENFVEKYFLSKDFVGQIGRSILSLKGIESKENAQQFKEKGVFVDKDKILK
jgi:ribosomal 30S subunit maturation factor RimM